MFINDSFFNLFNLIFSLNRRRRHGRVPDDPPEEDDHVPGRQGEHDGGRAQEDDRGHHQAAAQPAEALQPRRHGQLTVADRYVLLITLSNTESVW